MQAGALFAAGRSRAEVARQFGAGLPDCVQAVVLAYETGLVAPGREEAPSRLARGAN